MEDMRHLCLVRTPFWKPARLHGTPSRVLVVRKEVDGRENGYFLRLEAGLWAILRVYQHRHGRLWCKVYKETFDVAYGGTNPRRTMNALRMDITRRIIFLAVNDNLSGPRRSLAEGPTGNPLHCYWIGHKFGDMLFPCTTPAPTVRANLTDIYPSNWRSIATQIWCTSGCALLL